MRNIQNGSDKIYSVVCTDSFDLDRIYHCTVRVRDEGKVQIMGYYRKTFNETLHLISWDICTVLEIKRNTTQKLRIKTIQAGKLYLCNVNSLSKSTLRQKRQEMKNCKPYRMVSDFLFEFIILLCGTKV